jgi:hypothetical protein
MDRHAGSAQHFDQALMALGAARRLVRGAHFNGGHGSRAEVADQQIDPQAPGALQPLRIRKSCRHADEA